MRTLAVLFKSFVLGIFSLGLMCGIGLAAQEKAEGIEKSQESGEQVTEPESPEGTSEQVEAPEALKEASGQVAVINEDRNLLTIKKAVPEGEGLARFLPRKPMTFAIDEETSILGGEHPLKLEDLKAGEQVQITYDHSWFGRRIARSITVL